LEQIGGLLWAVEVWNTITANSAAAATAIGDPTIGSAMNEKAGGVGPEFTIRVYLCDLPSRRGLAYLYSGTESQKAIKAKEGRRRAFR
jgi:hypothetical protein